MINMSNKFNRNLFTESIVDEDKITNNKSKTSINSANSITGVTVLNTVNVSNGISNNSNVENGVSPIVYPNTNQLQSPSPVKNRRIKQFEAILAAKIIKLSELKSMAWKGIPFEPVSLRSDVWKILLGYYPSNKDLKENMVIRKRQEYLETCLIYESLLENPTKNMNDSEMKIYKQISVDVPRTMPEHKLFSHEIIRRMMLRVLYVWSMRHPASGYVQGFNDLCTPFFLIFIMQRLNGMDIESTLEITETALYDLGQESLLEIESDTYWCFTKMMDRIQNNYTHNQPGLTLMINKMELIIKLVDEDLYNHLIQFDITFMQFSFRWMNCYLMREFSLKLIIRIWDTYFSEVDAFNSFHLYVCAGLLLNFSEKIKKMSEFQETMMFLQNLPMAGWTLEEIDVLLAKAYQIHTMYGMIVDKYSNSKY